MWLLKNNHSLTPLFLTVSPAKSTVELLPSLLATVIDVGYSFKHQIVDPYTSGNVVIVSSRVRDERDGERTSRFGAPKQVSLVHFLTH
jgi:hypothetical protein